MRNELAMADKLDHPSIPSVIEGKERAHLGAKQAEVAYIVQELVPGGELFDYVAEIGAFSEPECRFYFDQMLESIDHIHSRGLAHLDIKLENMMLSESENFQLKVIDFGFATPLEGEDGNGLINTRKGTPGYQAPEIVKRQSYSGKAADLFALGVSLCIMHAAK